MDAIFRLTTDAMKNKYRPYDRSLLALARKPARASFEACKGQYFRRQPKLGGTRAAQADTACGEEPRPFPA